MTIRDDVTEAQDELVDKIDAIIAGSFADKRFWDMATDQRVHQIVFSILVMFEGEGSEHADYRIVKDNELEVAGPTCEMHHRWAEQSRYRGRRT